LGVINRTKAFFAGRRGQPLLQPYWDIRKLFHKGATYSVTTTWVFRAGPVVGMAIVVIALFLIPMGSEQSVVSFTGDFILVAYLLGLVRVFTVFAALDTGSSFEGMGASREVQFSLFAELAFLFGLIALAWKTGHSDASSIFASLNVDVWRHQTGVLALLVAAFLMVILAECSRIPFDDPNTHLELTMIHEVMVLDHSGPDLGMIHYSYALKLWVLGAFIVQLVFPMKTAGLIWDLSLFFIEMMVFAVVIGVIESCMARLKLINVPRLLMGAGALSFLAFLLGIR
jgi:formate hydrogenlyase subunit 4